MAECADKNMIDKDEYPRTAELERRCVAMLADLWHAPDPAAPSAARPPARVRGVHARRDGAQAPLDAAQRRPVPGEPPGRIWSWASTSRSAGRSSAPSGRSRPARCPWRATGSTSTAGRAGDCATRTPSASSAVLGSTFDGSYEPVADICAALDELQERTGLDIPVHVDGGVRRDDRALPRRGPGLGLPAAARGLDQHLGAQVRAGLPGRRLGAVAGRGRAARGAGLPGELPRRRHADLRAELLPAGRPGRRAVLHLPAAGPGRLPGGAAGQPGRGQARWPERIGTLGGLPADDRGRRAAGVRVHHRAGRDGVRRLRRLAAAARARLAGARVHLPANRQDLAVLRVVCRNGFSEDLADLLMEDLNRVLPELRRQPQPVAPPRERGHRLPPLTAGPAPRAVPGVRAAGPAARWGGPHRKDRPHDRAHLPGDRDRRHFARERGRRRASNGIARASQTLRGLDWFEVTQVRGHIEDGQVAHFQVGLKVGFRLEDTQ